MFMFSIRSKISKEYNFVILNFCPSYLKVYDVMMVIKRYCLFIYLSLASCSSVQVANFTLLWLLYLLAYGYFLQSSEVYKISQ